MVCEGYLPRFGRENAWRGVDEGRGGPVFVLAPELEPGTGVVVRVLCRGIGVENAELCDPETGVVRGVTDDRGFALVRDAGSADFLRVTCGGYLPRELRLDPGPLTRCQLRRP